MKHSKNPKRKQISTLTIDLVHVRFLSAVLVLTMAIIIARPLVFGQTTCCLLNLVKPRA